VNSIRTWARQGGTSRFPRGERICQKTQTGKDPKGKRTGFPCHFKDIETAIKEIDLEKVSILMASFLEQKGGWNLPSSIASRKRHFEQLFGPLGFLHSIILLEMLERTDQDSWPALLALASYFCKGRFDTTPVLRTPASTPTKDVLNHNLLRQRVVVELSICTIRSPDTPSSGPVSFLLRRTTATCSPHG